MGGRNKREEKESRGERMKRREREREGGEEKNRRRKKGKDKRGGRKSGATVEDLIDRLGAPAQYP